MKPKNADRQLAQRILNIRTGARLEEDGVFGSRSVAASTGWITWAFRGVPDASRWVAAVIQKEALSRGVITGPFDAYWGSQTEDAADRLRRQFAGDWSVPTRPDEVHDEISSDKSGIRCWSPSTAAFRDRYGSEGRRQDFVHSPYVLKLDWDLSTSITRFMAHQLLVTPIERAMQDTLSHYGPDEISRLGLDRFGGCLNVRAKRGGSTPSTHSWGAAVDWYPSRNRLKQTRMSALFAKKPYEAFLDIWEAHGFMSLGRCYDFDWMHLQGNP